MRRLKRNPRQRRTRTKWMNTLKSIMIIPLCTLTVLITPALAQHVPFRCSVKFDKDFYMPGEKVTIYGTVTFNDNPVEGAKVVVNIKDFGLSGLEATTDSNGNWTLSFRVPDNQKFGAWLVEVEVTYKENSIKMLQKIRIGEASEINEVEILKSRIAELNRENMELKDENQRLQDQIRELKEEVQRLQEAGSRVSFWTLGATALVLVAAALAVFVVYKRRSRPQNSGVIE